MLMNRDVAVTSDLRLFSALCKTNALQAICYNFVLISYIFSTVVAVGTERRKSDTGITLPTLRVSLIQDMRYII